MIYDAIKVTPQISDLKQTHQTCQKLAKAYDTIGQTRFEDASVLHSIVSHNDYMNKHDWDLKDFMDHLRFLTELEEFDSDKIYEKALFDIVYGARIPNKVDRGFIMKLINQVVVQKKYDIGQFVENSHKFYSKLEKANNSK